MNSLIKVAAVLIIAVSFAACEKTNNPVTPSSLDKANIQVSSVAQSGTFEITFPDARSTAEPASLSGTIYFRFDDATSTYKYSGTFNNKDQDKYYQNIENTGRFERKGDIINLIDNPVTHSSTSISSLYLNGDYQYSERGNQIIIEGESQLGHIMIVLNQ
jgi:hypothetical protein